MKFFLVLSLFFLIHCQNKTTSSSGVTVTNPPELLQVFNSSSIGYYKTDGTYGFGSYSNSVLTTNIGSSPTFVQNTKNGILNLTSSSAKKVLYVDSYRGSLRGSSLDYSSLSFPSDSTTDGIAISEKYSRSFVVDSTQMKIFSINTIQSQFAVSNSSSASQYFIESYVKNPNAIANVDQYDQLAITDSTKKTVTFFNSQSGEVMASNPNPITLDTNVCSSIGKIKSFDNRFYVACNSTSQSYLAIIESGTSPNLAIGITSGLSFTSLSSIIDFTFSSSHRVAYAISSKKLQILNLNNYAVINNTDFTDCDTNINLSAVTYSSTLDVLFISDSQNSRIYKFKGDGSGFVDTNCTTSRFQVSDVATPVGLNFF